MVGEVTGSSSGPSLLGDGMAVTGGHVVQFFDQDDDLASGVAAHLEAGLSLDQGAVVIAGRPHRVAVASRLRELGIDTAALKAGGCYQDLDAAETLEAFLVDGWPDAEAFAAVVGGLLRRAGNDGRPLRVFGEMVALLWSAGQVPAAIELESFWNELSRLVPFSLMCAYPSQSVSGVEHLQQFERLCHLHSGVVGPPPGCVRRGSTGGAVSVFAKADDAPRWARHFVQDRLGEWGAEAYAADAALVVTELATNAITHAGTEFRVVLSLAPGSVRISVADGNGTEPGLHEFSSGGNSGRGLGIVSAVAARWGTEPLAAGKAVWAELRS
ncbi:MAG: MEDS domain-containing protein [Acidimicrobiales bacterium]